MLLLVDISIHEYIVRLLILMLIYNLVQRNLFFKQYIREKYKSSYKSYLA